MVERLGEAPRRKSPRAMRSYLDNFDRPASPPKSAEVTASLDQQFTRFRERARRPHPGRSTMRSAPALSTSPRTAGRWRQGGRRARLDKRISDVTAGHQTYVAPSWPTPLGAKIDEESTKAFGQRADGPRHQHRQPHQAASRSCSSDRAETVTRDIESSQQGRRRHDRRPRRPAEHDDQKATPGEAERLVDRPRHLDDRG